MKYGSTRGNTQRLDAAEAIIAGIADDGGLFVPERMPTVDQAFIERLVNMTYQERAVRVLGKFLTDYTEEELKGCVERAYGGQKFDDARIAPVAHFGEGRHVLELWHGPTSAFKDMALQLLPQLLSAALKKTGEKAQIMILVATSGDTGKAALEGFKDVAQTRVMVFYPEDGVSRVQRLQMATQAGANVGVAAVKGNFDDAQSGVKQLFSDAAFNAALRADGVHLSSANSINWGRLVPQIVYYFSAYADLIRDGKITAESDVNFTVPTGNFGNILAGYYAKEMGLPIRRLICASNANHVLTDFLRTGTYDRNRAFHRTASPSMDILISSNLERLLHCIGGDAAQVKAWMDALRDAGNYTVTPPYLDKIKDVFWAEWADDEQTLAKIRAVYEAHRTVIDTHTAVAWHAADAYRQATGDRTPNIIVSTASPYKFGESVLTALGRQTPASADEFTALALLEELSAVKIPAGLASLRTANILHAKRCGKADMARMVQAFSKETGK